MDTSPTALFDSYETEFRQFIDTIRERLETSGQDDISDQRRLALRRVEMELDEADEMVSQMELEIQGVPPSVKSQYQTRLRSSKEELSKYKKALAEARSQLARSELLSSSRNNNTNGASYNSSDDPYGGASGDRSRLLAGTSILEQGTKRLQDSQRLAIETENQGAEILMNLRQQREQIESSRSTLERADLAIDRASSTLKKMVRRMYQQRAITYSIIAVLVLLIVVIIYEKYFA